MARLKNLILPAAYVRTLAAFRRSPFATPIQALLKIELEKSRDAYEAEYGAVEAKAYIAAIKHVEDVLFNSVLGNE